METRKRLREELVKWTVKYVEADEHLQALAPRTLTSLNTPEYLKAAKERDEAFRKHKELWDEITQLNQQNS